MPLALALAQPAYLAGSSNADHHAARLACIVGGKPKAGDADDGRVGALWRTCEDRSCLAEGSSEG